MQIYRNESLHYLDKALRNELEMAGVHYGKDGHYVKNRGDYGFQKPIIAHILFNLPYELTWTDAKRRSRIFPLQWHSVVRRIIRELKEANKKLAIETSWDTSPLTKVYDEHHRYIAAARIQALFRRIEWLGYKKVIHDRFSNHREFLHAWCGSGTWPGSKA
jgi:hypothetical protein